MSRWQPDAPGRLGQAALELYAERGYEQVTVAEIAERAGLTARTFFRYYADKREVLFAGSDALAGTLATALDAAPPDHPPLAAVAAALDRVARVIGGDREHSRSRQQVIARNADLTERELTKLATWARLLADGLRRRGVDAPTASLVAETGVAVFRVAYERWLTGPKRATLSATLGTAFDQLRAVAGAG